MGRLGAEQAVQRWYANKLTLMGVTFPIYAAEGWPARINGSGSHGDDLTQLTIAHAQTLSESMFVQRKFEARVDALLPATTCQRGTRPWPRSALSGW